MPDETLRDVVASSDDEIKAIIRQRRASGLPCNPVALRDAIGRGGTERLARLSRKVRAESLSEAPAMLDGVIERAEDAFPPELRKLFEALKIAVSASISRARLEERATNATVIEGVREEGERRVHALAAMESAGADDTVSLASSLDVMTARVEQLETLLASMEARLSAATSGQASAEVRAEEAERRVEHANDTVHTLRIERDVLQQTMASLQKLLEPLIARLSPTPPSIRRARRRTARNDPNRP